MHWFLTHNPRHLYGFSRHRATQFLPLSAEPGNRFRCRHFTLQQEGVGQKLGTDSMLLGSWATVPPCTGIALPNERPCRILDIGTGSGVLALMIAQKAGGLDNEGHRGFSIDAIDVHLPSCLQARINFDVSLWGRRMRVLHSSLQLLVKDLEKARALSGGTSFELAFHRSLSPLDDEISSMLNSSVISPVTGGATTELNHSVALGLPDAYDMIICNPPYFFDSTKPGSQWKAGARHSDISLPFEELASGVSSMLSTANRIHGSPSTLPEAPSAYIVLPTDGADRFTAIAEVYGLQLVEVLRVKTRAKDAIEKRRLLKYQRFRNPEERSSVLDETLIVTEEIPGHGVGYYTQDYWAMTEEFHHPDYVMKHSRAPKS